MRRGEGFIRYATNVMCMYTFKLELALEFMLSEIMDGIKSS